MAKSTAAKLTTLTAAAGAAATKEAQALDRLIHEKVRLGIVSALAASGLAMNARVELECIAYVPQKKTR